MKAGADEGSGSLVLALGADEEDFLFLALGADEEDFLFLALLTTATAPRYPVW